LLPPKKLAVVFDFVSYLAEQQMKSDSLDWGVGWAWIGHWLGIYRRTSPKMLIYAILKPFDSKSAKEKKDG
jgi:hypothetical protein